MKIKTLLFASLLLALMAGNAKAQDNELFNQGFDDPNYLTGWTFNGIQIQIGESVPYGVIDEDICKTGPNSFHFGNNMSDYGYLISPELTDKDPQKGVSVSFYYTNYYKDCASEFKVGYSTTTADPGAFNWGEMVTASNGKYDLDLHAGDPDWKEYVNSFPADAKYIAIAKVIGGFHLFVDDIVLSETDCAMPSIPVVTNVASDAITVEWSGTAQGLKCSSMQDYGFEDEVEELGDWTTLGSEYCWWSSEDASGHNSKYCVLSDVIGVAEDNYLVSPEMVLGGRITFYAMGVEGGGSFKGHQRDGDFNLNFKVMVKEPNDVSFKDIPGAEFEASIEGWVRYSVDLSAYSGQGYVAICHIYDEGEKGVMDDEEYWLAIDDITLYAPPVVQADEAELYGISSYPIEGLEEMTKYAIQLQGCEDQWTDALYVATLPEGGINSYEFVQDGYWSEITNWKNWYMPQGDNDNVVISANARIPANYVAKAGAITISDDGGAHPVYYGSITIADGGQLRHSNQNVSVTMEKDITGYTNDRDNYQLLAFPIVNSMTISYNNLGDFATPLTATFDLYKFDQSQDLEWINYEQENSEQHPFTIIENGVGYLYGNEAGGTFRFNIGNLKPSNNNEYDINDVIKGLDYTSGKGFSGWNLVGNPFACNAYLLDDNGDERAFWRLQEVDGESKIVLADNNVIAPLEGIFVLATGSGQSVTFTAEEPLGESMNNMFDFTLRRPLMRSESCLDRTRVRIGEGHNMDHLDLMADPNRLYIPMDGKAMSVVYSQPVGELPLNFEAADDGTFVLGFANNAEDLAYCHLIDNMTGADIDLLKYPEYTFEAKNDDYASRFRVVFVAKDAEGIAEDSETFAFNSYGSWIIVNEGLATLQMVDINGRMISNETIEGYTSMKFNVAPGVYVLRLVNGENVRVQKMVVR